MSASVCATDMDSGKLAETLAALRPHAPYAILERVDDLTFPSPDERIDQAWWPRGRIFGPDLDLRWEQQGEHYHVVLVHRDRNPLPQGFNGPSLDLSGCDAKQIAYYLWGAGEVRIGRRMDYRAMRPGPGREQLLVEEFRDREDGRLVFHRYVEMRREG